MRAHAPALRLRLWPSPVTGLGDVVTAGNSSSLNDGAFATSWLAKAIDKYNLRRALAWLPVVRPASPQKSWALVRCRPPKKSWLCRLTVDDLTPLKSEAFATQSLASIRRLGLNPDIVNTWGGAIALGHPLGSSGSRIVITLLSRLEAAQQSRGLATMCIGVGQGAAMLIERV